MHGLVCVAVLLLVVSHNNALEHLLSLKSSGDDLKYAGGDVGDQKYYTDLCQRLERWWSLAFI